MPSLLRLVPTQAARRADSRRYVHAFEAAERDRHGGEAAVAGDGGHDRVGTLAEIDLGRLLPDEPGDERVVDERVEREAGQNGGEKNPERGKHAQPYPPDDVREDAEDGERHKVDDPPQYPYEPVIDAFPTACTTVSMAPVVFRSSTRSRRNRAPIMRARTTTPMTLLLENG